MAGLPPYQFLPPGHPAWHQAMMAQQQAQLAAQYHAQAQAQAQAMAQAQAAHAATEYAQVAGPGLPSAAQPGVPGVPAPAMTEERCHSEAENTRTKQLRRQHMNICLMLPGASA